MAAAASGELDSLQALLKSHPVPLDRVLAEAIRHDQINVVKWCIEAGAKYIYPIITALQGGDHFESFRLLVHSGLDIDQNLDRLGTFLILEMKRNNIEHASFCLENGANPNLGSYAHIWSALAVAAQYGTSIEVVDLLLKNEAKLEESDALATAAENGRTDLVEFLLDRGAKVDEFGFLCCTGSEVKMDNAGSALHLAVGKGHIETVHLLLDRGADINLKDDQERTPLARAQKKDNQKMISLLQERGAVQDIGR